MDQELTSHAFDVLASRDSERRADVKWRHGRHLKRRHIKDEDE